MRHRYNGSNKYEEIRTDTTLKISKIIIPSLMLSLMVLGLVPAYAQDITGYNWIGTSRTGSDPFYGTNVVAYQAGSTATLAINFGVAPGDPQVNVTKVTIYFDWGTNYTSPSTSVPVIISQGVLRTFSISINVPSTSTATNTVTHTYTIFVEYKITPAPQTRARTVSASNFAIYSSDQAAAMNYMQRLGGPASSGYNLPVFRTSQASALQAQAVSEANLGQSLYMTGDFANARLHLANANNLLGNATSIEQSRSNYLDISMITSGYGSILLGIGATLIGIAALLYLVQRRRQFRSNTAKPISSTTS
ncbi:MAG TPA: hypothetical protein VFE98_00270 [Candidatus Bathyarchaeia archaeon]|nr:hypothetical protein [Candidatus Bathyarchaeia archaeon]